VDQRWPVGRPRVPLLLLLTATLVAVPARPAWAPAPDKPEKIKAGPIKWTCAGGSSSFEVPTSATAHLAQRAEREGHLLVATLVISDRKGDGSRSQVGETLRQTDPAVVAGRGETRNQGMVALVPQVILWDQPCGEPGELLRMVATVELVGGSGPAHSWGGPEKWFPPTRAAVIA